MLKPIICHDYFGEQYTFDESDYIERTSVYGLLIDQGHILMVRDSSSGRWEFPGGGVEQGEGEFDALKREFLEETGLIIESNYELIGSFTEYYYDLSTKKPWKALRKFYKVVAHRGDLLELGNNDDVDRAMFIGKTRFTELRVTNTIKRVANLAVAF